MATQIEVTDHGEDDGIGTAAAALTADVDYSPDDGSDATLDYCTPEYPLRGLPTLDYLKLHGYVVVVTV